MTTNYTPNHHTVDALIEEARSAFPWARFETTRETRDEAEQLIEWTNKNFIQPDDLVVRISRNRTFDRPSWRGAAPYPDTFTVTWSSVSTQEAQAEAQIDIDYPVFNRLAS